jgi:AcrR family transcriptional regulator
MREDLITVAIEKFGKRGFDAVGTRELAAAVGTPMSSITYHFGGKEGLYLAAAEHIFDQLQLMMDLQPVGLPAGDMSRNERLASLCARLRKVGEFMLREESAPFALFVSREQQSPTDGVLKLMREKMEPLMEVFVSQVKLLRPDLDEREARTITLFLFGMAITLRHSRASLRILLEIDEIDPATAEMLLDQLDQTIRRVLSGSST